ncbi:YhdP family protein [Nisaea nitritireducens]|uniref:YhdP family protein n=1 Tax=Nisaea nitritireducens TaxID=568392 RepID=UPI0018676B78|nr:AsmA-like C-terminal domain-containing protein [Nisaea nitritireducens]
MLIRTTKIALEIAAAIFAGIVVLAALVFWRASTQPVPLEFLKSRVAEALIPAERGTASIGELSMEWRGWSRLFEVRVTSLRLNNQSGGVILFAPSADIALSGPQLLLGEIAPVHIAVDQPVLNMERQVDGSYALYGAAPSGGDADAGNLLSVLQEPPKSGQQGLAGLERLERFSLRRATVRVKDDAGQFGNIRLSGFDGTFERERNGWRVEARADLTVGGDSVEIRGDGNYFYRSRTLDGAVLFQGLAPDLVLSRLPELPVDFTVSSRLSGSIAFALQDFRALESIDVIATATNGAIALGSVLPAPLPYDSLRFQIGYDGREDSVALRNFVLERGGMVAVLQGSLKDLSNPALELSTKISGLPVDNIKDYWPPELFEMARGWTTENLQDGTVTEITARVTGHMDVDVGKETRFREVAVDGELAYEDVTVHYLPPLPPALKVGGTLSFTEKRLDAAVTTGYFDGIKLKGAKVSLTGIHTVSDDYAMIDADIDGPISDILRVLDTEPFGYARALGVSPDEVTGTAQGRMHFEMPLLRVMTFDMVDLSAEGQLSDVSLPTRTTRLPFEQGDMSLKLDKNGMLLDGSGTLSGLPMQLGFLQSFDKEAEIRRRTHVIVRPDTDKLADLGLDIRRFASGEVELDATIEEETDTEATIDLVLGLQNTELEVAELAWEKPSGSAGTLRASLQTRNDVLTSIDSFQVATGDLAASGSVEFSEQTNLPRRLTVERLQLGKTDLSGVIAADGTGGFTANIEGPFADLRPLVDQFDGHSGDIDLPLVVNARVDQVVIGNLDPMRDVTVLLENDGAGTLSLAANGLLGMEPVDVFYSTADDSPHFEISSQNAGNLLKSFEGFDSIVGGKLAATGFREELDGRVGWNVSLSVLDFNLTDAPVMAQLLSAASIAGLPSVVQGRGIHFANLDASMHVSEELLVLERLLAQGAALGISASGSIDRVGGEMDLTGMLVPAYVLNEIIDAIPLIGTLLTGGEGEGFLASEFGVSGPLVKPVVTVNPLTALTPGIFRNLFRLSDAPPKDPEPAEPPPQDTSP